MMETTPATTAKRTVKARTSKTVESKPGKTPAPETKPSAGTLKLGKAGKAAAPPEPPPATPVATKAAPKPRKPSVKKAAVETPPSAMAHSEAEILHMIAEAAYFMAEQRQFAPGYEHHDWLVAEQMIRSKYQHA